MVLIHCWSGYPEYVWYPDAKRRLEALGFSVTVPAMPEADTPKLSLWLPKLKEAVGTPDENIYLIGHSIGCATIMRYLESLPQDTRIGGAVLVAGFTDDLGYQELKNFFETPLDFPKIRSGARRFVLIHSDDDPYVPVRYGDILKRELGGELIVKHNAGHFSTSSEEGWKGEECRSLPDVVGAVERVRESLRR